MWASSAKCVGSCGSRIRSQDWQDSSDGQGGWLVTGSEEGVVGISWIASENAAPDDNLACTKEACFYKSHFNMRRHVGQVSKRVCMQITNAYKYVLPTNVMTRPST